MPRIGSKTQPKPLYWPKWDPWKLQRNMKKIVLIRGLVVAIWFIDIYSRKIMIRFVCSCLCSYSSLTLGGFDPHPHRCLWYTLIDLAYINPRFLRKAEMRYSSCQGFLGESKSFFCVCSESIFVTKRTFVRKKTQVQLLQLCGTCSICQIDATLAPKRRK